ncbi:MAG: hypothetical protein OJF49_000564 [Ktedonobacterales bacterium]|nr:MAG: hypothetical protein OJF49_000564 [Ktedonobacterales bacterium]
MNQPYLSQFQRMLPCQDVLFLHHPDALDLALSSAAAARPRDHEGSPRIG